MTQDKIGRCYRCGKMDWVDADGHCFDDGDTQIILYSTGILQAATPPVTDDKPEAA